jgi:hypothetical protein
VYYYYYLLLSRSSDALNAVVLTFQSVSVERSSIVLNGFLEFSLLSLFLFLLLSRLPKLEGLFEVAFVSFVVVRYGMMMLLLLMMMI